MRLLHIDLSKCTGCRRCETACAFFHTGKVSNRLARIKVMHLFECGVDSPVVCIQCDERYCMSCAADAMNVGQLGQIVVNRTQCTVCGTCVNLCPIGAIEVFNDNVIVCDLCNGNPKCVEACTENAIQYLTQTIERPSLSDFYDDVENLNPSQKRHLYVERHGKAQRKTWGIEHA